MGQDGNTIEIEIDAAATQAAAKTAGEANAKLEEFNNALKLFRDNVDTISTTTDSVAGKIGDFNTLLQTFSDKLTENLANMQTSVVAKVEPHLERELENLVNRVTNKVEAKYQPEKESRSRSEAKAGAGATPQVVPSGKRISVASPPGERPDALLKEQLVKSNERIVDKVGNVIGGALKTTSKQQMSRFEFGQEKNAAGELVDIRREIVDEVKTITKTNFVDPYGKDTTLRGQDRKTSDLFSMLGPEGLAKVENAPEVRLKDTFYGSISDALDKSLEKGFSGIEQYVPEMTRAAEKNIWKPHEKQLEQNEKTVQAATVAEKDRGLAIRREITGALIGLHVMKVVAQYSAVFNAGFMQIAAAIGHLLNNLLLPMMPMFTQVAQFLHMLANVIAMLPMPVRQLIGALLIWKATSMMVASMPLKDIKDGFAGIKEVMQGADSGIKKFWALLRAFVDFMNSGQGRGALGSLVAGGKAVGGRIKGLLGRASGGPVLGHGAYIVGEKGPEIFVPKTSGTIVPNHKIGRAEGGDVTAAPFGGDILGNLGAGVGLGGLAYLLTGSPMLAGGAGLAGFLGPEGVANLVSSAVSSELGQNFIASMNVLTGMISAILAPLAPIMGVIGAVLGFVTGSKGAMGGDGGRTADAVVRVGNEQLKATGKMNYGVQNAVGMGNRGVNKLLSMILTRLSACLLVTPCVPGIFGAEIVTAITALGTILAGIPASIKIAIEDIAAKIRYTLETTGIEPVATDKTATIRYNIETAGTNPTTEDVTAKIRYTIETVGEKPVVEDVTARIAYNVETVGEKPTATDIDAKIRYTLETTGIEPVATDKTAKITYNIEKIGTEPVATDTAATIRYNIETTGAIPTTEDVTAKIRYTTEGVTLPTTFDITGKVTSIDLTKIPIELAKVELGGIVKDVKVAEPLKAKPPEIDTRGRIIDAKPSDAIRTKVPEIDVSGKVRTIDVTGIDPSKTRIPVDIDPKIPEGFNWRKAFEGAKLGGLKDIGKTGGGLFLVGFALALDEFGRTGKVNWGGLLVGLGTAFVLWTGAEAALVGVATKLAGAAAGTAVAGAMSTVGLALIAAMLIPIAANLGGDITSAIQKGINSGGWVTSGMFDNFALKAAFELGDSFQGALNAWMKSNFNFDLNQFITDTSKGENGWFFDMLQAGASSAIQLTLGPGAAAAFNKFIDDIQRTLSGGIPVDVKIDVDSVTSVVNAVRETAMGTPISGGASVPGETVGECPQGQYWDRALQACAPIQGSVIPSHASGGRVTPYVPNLVGELGPELFVPDRTGVSGGGGGGQSVTINQTFNVTTNNPKELTDTVMKQLKLELTRVKM